MNDTDTVKCYSCEMTVNRQDCLISDGHNICEGCVEGLHEDPADDPHGRGFTNNNAYNSDY